MYTAIIVEPRKHRALSFVLNNVLTNLSDDWNVIVCHGTANKEFVETILDTDLKNVKSRVSLVNLGVENYTSEEYNAFIASKKYHDLIPTEMFLNFQTDSIIIPKHASLINNFLKYDYVGAPWSPHGEVGNGGLSLRRKSKMLEIIEDTTYVYSGGHEDLFFSRYPNIYKPSSEEAKLFSVETIFSEITFGCHKPWSYDGGRQILDLYPEIKTLASLQ